MKERYIKIETSYHTDCKGCVFAQPRGRCIAEREFLKNNSCLIFRNGKPTSYIFKKIPIKLKII